MDPAAMEPFGEALLVYFQGETRAQLLIRRDDSLETPVPVELFFRHPADFSSIEKEAIERCGGCVLDIGAGTGLHSLVLQRRGLRVTALDLVPQAAEIMRRRGVKDVRRADCFDFREGCFDTLLMLGHVIGLVETIAGLGRFLRHARGLVSEGGQVLLDSMDVRASVEAANVAYHEANRKAGRYVGEIRLQFEFRGRKGPFCGWLHVDADTLEQEARAAGWLSRVIQRGPDGNYLACLRRLQGRVRGSPAPE